MIQKMIYHIKDHEDFIFQELLVDFIVVSENPNGLCVVFEELK